MPDDKNHVIKLYVEDLKARIFRINYHKISTFNDIMLLWGQNIGERHQGLQWNHPAVKEVSTCRVPGCQGSKKCPETNASTANPERDEWCIGVIELGEPKDS